MKNSQGSQLKLIVSAGMDICWLQAWSVFVLHSIFKCHVPLLFVLFIYSCGIITNFFCYSGKRIRFQVVLMKLVFLPTTILAASHYFLFRYNNNINILNFSQLFTAHKSFEDWALVLTVLIIAGLIWRRSTVQVIKPLNQETVYYRFDLGVAAFFLLMVLKLLLSAKYGVIVTRPDLSRLFLPFFLFALLTIGLILSAEKEDRYYQTGFQKIGIALSFSIVMLSGVSGIFILFNAQLMASAEIISGILKKAGPSLEGAIIWIVRTLWSSKSPPELPASSGSGDQTALGNFADSPVETGWLAEIIKWSIAGLIGLMLIVLALVLIRHLIMYLLSVTSSVNQQGSWSFSFRKWLNRFKTIFPGFLNRVAVLFSGINSAAGLYKALLTWGRRSGIPNRQTYTLTEYSNRLVTSFPCLKTEIETIVQLIQLEIYGEIELHSKQIAAGKKAKQRMEHPVFWKKRLKTWVVSPWN